MQSTVLIKQSKTIVCLNDFLFLSHCQKKFLQLKEWPVLMRQSKTIACLNDLPVCKSIDSN